MTVNRYATRAGKQYEADVVRHLRDEFLDAERLRLTGAEDEGDVILRLPQTDLYAGRRIILECKREKGFYLAGWVDQAELEAKNYAKHRDMDPSQVNFAALAKRRGQGMSSSYVITPLREWLRQIR